MTYPEIAFKRVLNANDGGTWGDGPSGSGDTVVLRSTEQTADGRWAIAEPELRYVSPFEAHRFRLHKGDLLITKSSGSALHIGKTTVVDGPVASLKAVYSNFMQRVRLSSGEHPLYYWYVLRTPRIREQWVLNSTSTTGLANLNAASIGDLLVPHPPLDEQRQIAEYLDRETGKIDELIAKQEQLVATLTERRQAVIAQAVTRGLHPTTDLKESGSVWIGPIPISWEVVPCGFYALLIQTGPFGSQLHSEEYVENGVPLVNPMHLSDGRIVTSAAMSVDVNKALELSRHALQLGDVIIARRGELGRSAVVTSESVGFLCGTGSAIVRLRTNHIDPRFFQLVFSSRRVRDVLVEYSVGSTMDNLSAATVASLRISVPLIAEQNEIVAFVEAQGARIGVVVDKAREVIALLRERRAALISAAVTGKIDVRGL